jgi:hypothetical protein
VRMPQLPDPDLNPEELGQLLQKVRRYMASARLYTAVSCCAAITLRPQCMLQDIDRTIFSTCCSCMTWKTSTGVALFDSATISRPCAESVLWLFPCGTAACKPSHQ